jgi:hypothetical protein
MGQDLCQHAARGITVISGISVSPTRQHLGKLSRQHPRLRIEPFPSYVPDLNPHEGVWSLAKQELANGCPPDIDELRNDVIHSIDDIQKSPEKFRGCILQPTSPFFWADYCIVYAQSGAPLNFRNLSNRVIKPASKSKDIPWKGCYSFRRRLASNLSALKIEPQVIAGILQHDIATALMFYVQVPGEDTQKAMEKISDNTWTG